MKCKLVVNWQLKKHSRFTNVMPTVDDETSPLRLAIRSGWRRITSAPMLRQRNLQRNDWDPMRYWKQLGQRRTDSQSRPPGKYTMFFMPDCSHAPRRTQFRD